MTTQKDAAGDPPANDRPANDQPGKPAAPDGERRRKLGVRFG